MDKLHQILKDYWGYDAFRPLQEDIIRSALSGTDTLALLPTGSGKSICYQVPALATEGICLVVSPLIALMKDQVQQLQQKGITALAIHTGMSYREVMKTMDLANNSRLKLLYVSPERLQTRLFREFLPSLPINLLAIDEAHCVSQWGYDFRPSYLQIAALREWLPEIPILALTASATPLVQKDIIQQLQLRNPSLIKGSFARKNLSYSCFEEDNKIRKITQILNNVSGCAIIYCKSRKRTVDLCRHLIQNGISATFYHAGLPQEERHERQQQWTGNQVRVMVSTNAFGMGIDKPDVRTVIHYDVPDCLENYYQEAGRAGRDGQKSYAVLLYNTRELEELSLQLDKKYPPPAIIRKVYQSVADFLQLPTGTGEGNSYDFDLSLFCNNFHFDRATAISALQTLQAEGYCALNESVYVPSRVQFTTNRQWLETFETDHKKLEPLVKALLRNYEGIFNYPAIISEQYLSRILRSERSQVTSELQALQHYGIIDYSPQKDQPQLVLLTERMKAEHIRVNQEAISKRKELALERIQALKSYITGNTCRSQYVGRYFGDEKMEECGICDHCLNRKRLQVPQEKISRDILDLVQQDAQTYESIKSALNYDCDVSRIWQSIRILESEERIKVALNGTITSIK